MEKQFIQIQLGLFFKNDFQSEVENASLAIKKEFGSDVTPQIIGVPSDAPSEIPRLVINSSLVNINLAKNRIDFFSKQENFVQENFEKIFNIINSISVEIGRIGVVVTSFKEISISEFKKIFDQKKVSFVNPKEITVRFNEETNLINFKINNSQIYTTGFIKGEDGIQKSGVIITRDVNTLAEDIKQHSFSKDAMSNFIVEAISLADKILV
jgi:hypothetical protein